MTGDVARRTERGEPWNQAALPEPDEHADLSGIEPGETAPVWHLNGSVFDGRTWVRAATASVPMEIAGYDIDDCELDAMEHDLLAILGAIRASRTG